MITKARIQAVVQLQAVFGDRASQLNEVFDTLGVHGLDLAGVVGLQRQSLIEQLLFSSEQADVFAEARAMASRLAERIDHPCLSVLARSDAAWPRQALCPPVSEMMPWLFVIGDPKLLSARAIGVGGSRHATTRNLEATRQLVEALVERELVIVSGGARGVDAIAHRTALDQGGKTVVVLAQGIGTFSVPSHWWPSIERGHLTVVSEFSPMAEWEGQQALQRNGTVIRLSDAFLVVQAEDMSGTLSAGRSALRLKRPLFVVSQAGEGAESFTGNEQLIANGGTPLVMPMDGACPPAVVDALLDSRQSTIPPPDQMRLF